LTIFKTQIEKEDMNGLHPQMKQILDMLARENEGRPHLWEMTPAEARQGKEEGDARHWNVDVPEIHQTLDSDFVGAGGGIPIRLYDSGAAAPSPCLVYFHGGGFVMGSIATHDGLCRRLANYSGFRVVSVGYRLAPEHKFPAALEDCVAAVRWVSENSVLLGVDPDALFVGGDSAGANLSLASAIVLRDDSGPALRGAVLAYGNYDTDLETPSYKTFGGGEYFLSKLDMEWFWKHYLNGPQDRLNPKAVPLRANLSSLPPLFVAAAAFDPLLDDSRQLVERLRAINARHDWVVWPGVTHACLDMTRMLEPAEGFLRDIALWLQRQVASENSKSTAA
jgi:acetyl esterase